MLNTVNNFGKEFDVKFNLNKSQYIVFGNSKSIPMSIKLSETHLSPVESANYLGVIIGKNCSEAQSMLSQSKILFVLFDLLVVLRHIQQPGSYCDG